jgi:hypothetical protein
MDESRPSPDAPQDSGLPDSVERDGAALNSSEDLDQDRMRVDPLEEGVEPPEHWSLADHFGDTAEEQREGESLEMRVREEQPDVQPGEVPERPVAATPADQLDDSVDDAPADTVAPGADEPGQPDQDRKSWLLQEGFNADVAGGSVAEAIRTPPEDDDRTDRQEG